MGTIASILQWQCVNCNTVNPIECVRCCGCDTVRLLNEETSLDEDEDPPREQENSRDTTREIETQKQCLYRDIRDTLLAKGKTAGGGGEGVKGEEDKTEKQSPEPKKNHHHQPQQKQTGYLEIRPDG